MPKTQLTHLESLQAFLTARIAPARALGVTVAATEPVTISAPLEGNLNDKGTGFAGSLFSVAALAGWALVTRWCAVVPLDAEVALQSSKVRFLAPARGEFRAIAHELPDKQRQKLSRMLDRSARGRVEVAVDVMCNEALVMSFSGVYAVTKIARGETAPVETAPVEIAPVETALVETAPVEIAPVEIAPVEIAPGEAAPGE